MEFGRDLHMSQKMKPTVFFKTFGCRTNLFDTQVMIANLKDFVQVQNEDEAQIIVINSCTVTNGADSGVKSYLNKIKKTGKKIYFTGCGVQTRGKEVLEQVNGVFAHDHKEKINSLLLQEQRFYLPAQDEKHIDKTLVSEFVGKSRAFIKIQEGCDFRCSYCIIPFSRGKARSLEQSAILEQIKILAQKGIKEVVLTGTNMGSYGKDTQTNISKLIKAIAKINGIKRIRLGSLEPSQIDEEFLELLGEEFLENHLHIALQHTHNKMLEIMNRINRFESDVALLEKIADKGFGIGSDYIVGHPGENEEIWEEAYQNLQKMPLTHIHPFIYSPREGTPSAQMKPTVLGNIAKARLHQVNQLIEEKNLAFRHQHSHIPLKVLIETRKSGEYQGLDQFFNKVKIQSFSPISDFVTIKDYQIMTQCNLATLKED